MLFDLCQYLSLLTCFLYSQYQCNDFDSPDDVREEKGQAVAGNAHCFLVKTASSMAASVEGLQMTAAV